MNEVINLYAGASPICILKIKKGTTMNNKATRPARTIKVCRRAGA